MLFTNFINKRYIKKNNNALNIKYIVINKKDIMHIIDKSKEEIVKYNIKNDIIKFKNIENQIADIKYNNINYNFMTYTKN